MTLGGGAGDHSIDPGQCRKPELAHVPPSTCSVVPVTVDDRSDARISTASPMSSTVGGTPIGMYISIIFSSSSGGVVAISRWMCSGGEAVLVSLGVVSGATQFTRMRSGASSTAKRTAEVRQSGLGAGVGSESSRAPMGLDGREVDDAAALTPASNSG